MERLVKGYKFASPVLKPPLLEVFPKYPRWLHLNFLYQLNSCYLLLICGLSLVSLRKFWGSSSLFHHMIFLFLILLPGLSYWCRWISYRYFWPETLPISFSHCRKIVNAQIQTIYLLRNPILHISCILEQWQHLPQSPRLASVISGPYIYLPPIHSISQSPWKSFWI